MIKHAFVYLFLCPLICLAQTELSNDWQQRINQVLGGTLTRYHYIDQSINDNYSRRVFNLFINQVDPNKNFLTDMNMIELNAYEYKIDNDIRNNTFHFYDLALLRIKGQIEFSNSIYNTILKYPIELENPLSIEFDQDKKTYAKDNNDLTKRWKTNTQYQVAQNYIALYQEKYPSENTITIEKELEAEARLKTKKELDRRFKRLMEKTNEDYFTAYLDSIAKAFGPHTAYLPPEEKEDFDINMSGQLEGIGAILREDDGYIKVVRIIPGSASWRQGELKAEDIILKVQSNSKSDAISIIETPVREAVKLIRGPKGSTVTLTVKKPDGMIQTIPIQRDIVVIKSTYAKSGIFVIDDKQFGYINLPSFYRDFENSKNPNAADDVKAALVEFNKKNTAGMILDLRNNGGGSLKDAVDIAGFFIPQGPVVQVSNSYKQVDTYKDKDNQTYYSKPLIILVNTFSASASEIVSAALQDYGRAIILGNSHTFGKGTVQKVIDLDNLLFQQSNPLGYLKITIQEYFRINGQSTQFTGVIPDIVYPSIYDYLDVGEKELEYAFQGSKTTPAQYETWQLQPQLKSTVVKNSYTRLEQNPASKVIIDYNQFMTNQRNNSYRSIRLTDLWANLQNVKGVNKTLDDLTITKQFSTYISIKPIADNNDEAEKEELTKWIDGFDNDFLLNEAFQVLNQMATPIANND